MQLLYLLNNFYCLVSQLKMWAIKKDCLPQYPTNEPSAGIINVRTFCV